MIKTAILTPVFVIGNLLQLAAQNQPDYLYYHRGIVNAEELVTVEKYQDALSVLEKVFNAYEFVFLRDYKVAAQLALFLGDEKKAFDFIRAGISDGWTLKDIKKNKFLKPLRDREKWEIIKSQYNSLRNNYKQRLNQSLRAEVHTMFKRDQKLAFADLVRIGQKAKERYALKKFAPQSAKQMAKLDEMLNEYGYPGERLIGNALWMWTILCHHNSISTEYVRNDTIYPSLKPELLEAIRRGEISPYRFAVIEDWYIAVKSNRREAAYGYLNVLTRQELPKSNELRRNIGMRSIETRNRLVDIEQQTGMDFYLEGTFWVKGKIIPADKR